MNDNFTLNNQNMMRNLSFPSQQNPFSQEEFGLQGDSQTQSSFGNPQIERKGSKKDKDIRCKINFYRENSEKEVSGSKGWNTQSSK